MIGVVEENVAAVVKLVFVLALVELTVLSDVKGVVDDCVVKLVALVVLVEDGVVVVVIEEEGVVETEVEDPDVVLIVEAIVLVSVFELITLDVLAVVEGAVEEEDGVELVLLRVLLDIVTVVVLDGGVVVQLGTVVVPAVVLLGRDV